MKPPWTLSVATYNLLADAYIKPEHYPLVAPKDFLPANRHPLLDARVAALGTDVICLQEADYPTFVRLDARLRLLGYLGRWAHRLRGKADGCATFVRAPWRIRTAVVLDFEDVPPKPTNRVALVTVLERGEELLVVANAHFEWHAKDAAADAKHGLLQAKELLKLLGGERPSIVCGDFNATPDSETLEAFREAGFADPHAPSLATFNAGGKPRKIDYVLHTADLAATPSPTTRVGEATPLPSSTEPSDHVPLVASFAPKP